MNEQQSCPLLRNIVLELSVATEKPRSVLAEIETVHFRERKGTRIVHTLSAELETCTYEIIIQINYLLDMALSNFQVSGQHPEKNQPKTTSDGF